MMRGIEVPTTVWSMAAVKRPSMVPAMMIAFWRPLMSAMGLKAAAAAVISRRSSARSLLRLSTASDAAARWVRASTRSLGLLAGEAREDAFHALAALAFHGLDGVAGGAR